MIFRSVLIHYKNIRRTNLSNKYPSNQLNVSGLDKHKDASDSMKNCNSHSKKRNFDLVTSPNPSCIRRL